MSTASVILLVYFLGGLFALTLFDLATHRIRDKFASKVAESQIIFSQYTSALLGRRAMTIMLAMLTWLSWPVVMLGAVTDRGEPDQDAKVQKRDLVIGSGPRAQLLYWGRKIWYGECPDCHTILTPLDIWGQYAVCSVCKTEFKGIRLRASKEENHGKTKPREDSENRSGEGGTDIGQSEGDSEQPARAQDPTEIRP